MTELERKICHLISRPGLAAFATAGKDGRPWVRYVMARGTGDFSIRFATFVNSRKVAQVRHNSEVHLAWQTEDQTYLQIQGRARVSTEAADRSAFWHENLKRYFRGPDDPNYAVMIVRPYRIEVTEAQAMQPEVWQNRA